MGDGSAPILSGPRMIAVPLVSADLEPVVGTVLRGIAVPDASTLARGAILEN